MTRRAMKPEAGLTFEWITRDHTYPGGETVKITDAFRVYRNGHWIGDAGATISGDYYASVDAMGRGGRRTKQGLHSLSSAKRFIVREWRRSLDRYDLWPVTRHPGGQGRFVGISTELESKSIKQVWLTDYDRSGTVETDAFDKDNLAAAFLGE